MSSDSRVWPPTSILVWNWEGRTFRFRVKFKWDLDGANFQAPVKFKIEVEEHNFNNVVREAVEAEKFHCCRNGYIEIGIPDSNIEVPGEVQIGIREKNFVAPANVKFKLEFKRECFNNVFRRKGVN